MSVIQIAAESHADEALDFLCSFAKDITVPSSKALQSTKFLIFDAPLGTKLLRQVVELSIASKLPGPASQAINLINNRATQMAKNLPEFNELWIYNKENWDQQLNELEERQLHNNDSRVENYINGYLGYFAEIGKEAIERNLNRVSWHASNNISQQILNILELIEGERYQIVLISNALLSLKKIANTACKHRVESAFSIGIMSFGLKKTKYLSVARYLSHELSEIIVNMAKARILNPMTVTNFAVSMIYLAKNHSEIVPTALKALGEAGEALLSYEGFSDEKELIYTHNEIIQRIEQIGKSGLNPETKSDVGRLARQAKLKAKGQKRRGFVRYILKNVSSWFRIN
jgi:hypothetical protein